MSVHQSDFVDALLRPDADVPVGLVDPDGAPTTKRFNVYRNNVAVSLTEALETAFPAVQKLIGDENFKRVAGVFLRQHPPRSPLIMFYGEAFPGFLEGFEPLKHLGYLPDVARLEQALRETYHAGDAPAMDPGKLQGLPPDQLIATRFTLAPAVRVLPSPWPVHAIWAFNVIEGAPKPEMAAETVMITRPDFDPVPQVVAPGMAGFVEALQAGLPLSDALDAASHDATFDFTTALGQLLAGAAITDVRTNP